MKSETVGKKTIFLIAGNTKSADTDPSFDWLDELLGELGFEVHRYPTNWSEGVMSDQADKFIGYYEQHKGKGEQDKNWVLGFSFGALAAFIATQRMAREDRPDRLLLCSPSPFLGDDFDRHEPLRDLGDAWMEDFRSHRGEEYALDLAGTPTSIIYGEEEARQFPQMRLRAEAIAAVLGLEHDRIVVADGAGHDIGGQPYQMALGGLVRSLCG